MGCILKDNARKAYKKIKNPSMSEKDFVDDFTNMYTYDDGRLQLKFTKVERDDDLQDPVSKGMIRMNKYASDLMAGSVLPATLEAGSSVVEPIHKFAKENVPLYDNTVKWVGHAWENEPWVKQLKVFIKPDSIGDYEKFNKIMSMYNNAKQDNIKRMDEESKVMEQMFEDAYSKEDIEKFDSILAKSGIFYLTYNDTLSKIVKGETTIKDEITSMENSLTTGQVAQAENLSNVYLGKSIDGTPAAFNNSQMNIVSDKKGKLDALTSLKVLNKIEDSEKLLQDLYTNNNELYDKIVGLSISTKELMDEVLAYNGDTFKMRGNLIEDIPSVDYEMISVTEKDLKDPRYGEKEGWKILRSPESGKKLGIIYRENLQTMQDGMGVNISYIKNGIAIGRHNETKEYKNDANNSFIYSGDTKMLYLTEAEKKILKYENNPVKSIMRSYAHKELIRETQVIRDEFLQNMTKNYTRVEPEVINKELLESIEKKEHPVFLNLGDLSLEKAVKQKIIDPKIAREYEAVDGTILSDIGGFKKKVQYVRKDIGFYAVGYKDTLPFDSYNANKALSRVKDTIRWVKTNMIIVNPIKITMDMTSGMTLAASKGASFPEMWRYTQEAVKYSKEMTDLRNKRIMLKTEYRSVLDDSNKKRNLKKALDKVEKDIADHPFSGALANGFINSLATEMLSKERDSLKGLQVNIDRVLDKLTKEDNGDYTKFNNAVKKFAKAGVNVEVIFEGLGKRLEDTKGESFGKILKEVAKDMERAKTKEDMKDYLSQYILSPNSAFVRLGSAATLYADLIPRWIIYRHNINIGMPENEAATDALNSLLDYKMNLPPSLKFMSDLYFMPFPTFFVRIQRVLLNLAEKNPASFAANILSMELAGAHGQTILQSNIFNKWENDSIFTNTFDALKPSNMIPFSNAVPSF